MILDRTQFLFTPIGHTCVFGAEKYAQGWSVRTGFEHEQKELKQYCSKRSIHNNDSDRVQRLTLITYKDFNFFSFFFFYIRSLNV